MPTMYLTSDVLAETLRLAVPRFVSARDASVLILFARRTAGLAYVTGHSEDDAADGAEMVARTAEVTDDARIGFVRCAARLAYRSHLGGSL